MFAAGAIACAHSTSSEVSCESLSELVGGWRRTTAGLIHHLKLRWGGETILLIEDLQIGSDGRCVVEVDDCDRLPEAGMRVVEIGVGLEATRG